MLWNAWLHETEPFSQEELAQLQAQEVPLDHDDVMETISQFQACVEELIYLEPYRQTIYE